MPSFQNNQTCVEQHFIRLAQPESHWVGVEFEACIFEHCDFSAAHFARCTFIDCLFKHCNLSLMQVPGTRWFGVGFVECKLVGVDWTKADWPSFHLDSELTFRQCILNDSSFFGLTLQEIILDECKCRDVDFREGDFSRATMTGSDFCNSLFMRTQLQGSDFTNASDFNINVLENKINGARFSRLEALSLLYSLNIELVD